MKIKAAEMHRNKNLGLIILFGLSVNALSITRVGPPDDAPLTDNRVETSFRGLADCPSRDKRLGQSSSTEINIKVGQVVLARTAQDPTTIYILKIESQEQDEAMTVQYIASSQMNGQRLLPRYVEEPADRFLMCSSNGLFLGL